MSLSLSELLLSVFVGSATLSLMGCWRALRHKQTLGLWGLLWQLSVCLSISAWVLWLDADHARLTHAWPWCAMLTLLSMWGLTERAARSHRSHEQPSPSSHPLEPL